MFRLTIHNLTPLKCLKISPEPSYRSFTDISQSRGTEFFSPMGIVFKTLKFAQLSGRIESKAFTYMLRVCSCATLSDIFFNCKLDVEGALDGNTRPERKQGNLLFSFTQRPSFKFSLIDRSRLSKSTRAMNPTWKSGTESAADAIARKSKSRFIMSFEQLSSAAGRSSYC